jgi:PAS domain S-box-containing protein
MTFNQKIRVHFWDQFVLIGFALALFYSVFDSILYIFLEYDVNFFSRLLGPDISEIWSRLTILCLFAIFGAHAQFAVNQRLAAEKKLRQSEKRYRLIIETTPDGYFEVDIDGNFTYFNDAMCDILGYSRVEMTGMNHTAYLDESNSRKVMDALHHVYQTAESVTALGWTLKRQDGSRRYVESSISLITDPNGQPAGYSGFLRDVTERRRALALRQAKKAAEAANRSKSRFLANMSHEIRTPLNSIIGLIELMLETDLQPDQKEDLDVVISSAYALLALINNLLDFSKIEAGKFELEEAPFNVREFMQETIRMMAMKTQAKGLELAYRVAPEVPHNVVGDPGRLRQVLLNLIENSVKFTSQGEVVVEVTCEDGVGSETELYFSVQDTGIGIPHDKQRLIFDAFQQLDAKTSSPYGGTGLGLAVSAQLVELMGGKIRVDSIPGQGSRFRFDARFNIPAEKEDLPDRDYVEKLRGMHILVVDDNTTSRAIIREMVESWQMSPIMASGAKEAKAILKKAASSESSVDLALIDSDMPHSDGFALAQWLRSENMLTGKVIMMLTFQHLKRRAEFDELSVQANVVKPLHPLELQDAICIVLGLKTAPPRPKPTLRPPPPGISDQPLKILVAEDTPFNQAFIMRLLEKHGYHAALVENGTQVLEAMSRHLFDLVLMDVQMPEMDGFEATHEIRKLEKQTGNHIPIVAMTAYAVKGDRERCLAAGMDEYVSKPISSEKLFEAIKALLPGASGETPEPEKDAPALDQQSLLNAFDHDWNLFKELVEIFISDYPQMLAALQDAAGARDSETLSRAAHSLKGMLRNFQAEAAADTAFELEKMGKAGQLEGQDELIEKLDRQIAGVDKQLQNLVSQKI